MPSDSPTVDYSTSPGDRDSDSDMSGPNSDGTTSGEGEAQSQVNPACKDCPADTVDKTCLYCGRKSCGPHSYTFCIDNCTFKDIVRASMHRCGCRVIQRLVLHVEQESAAATKLHDSLLSNAKRIVQSFYGLCVMSVVRGHGSSELQQVI